MEKEDQTAERKLIQEKEQANKLRQELEETRRINEAREAELIQEKELQLNKQSALLRCIDTAQETYEKRWNTICEQKGLDKGCNLPLEIAESFSRDREHDRDMCYELHE